MAEDKVNVNVKGPSDVKMTVSLPKSATVREFKELIAAQNEQFPADEQRLIYSGRVLKDDEVAVEKYNIKEGHTVHLVKGAKPQQSSNPGASGSAAIGVPDNFAAGQQYAGNPLAPLLNAQNAGALAGFNPFASMGINPNDPNYINNMMSDPAVQAQMNQMLSDPAIVDQMIQASPELRAMGPQVRQMMQSEQFRSFLTNPDAMRQAAQMSAMFRGGAGGSNPFGGAGAATGGAAPNLFNPWAQTAPTPTSSSSSAETPSSTAQTAPQMPAFNPFAMFGPAPTATAGGDQQQQQQQQPDFAAMMEQMRQLQQLGGFGGFGGGQQQQSSSAPQVPPEERYQVQLEQLANMGFTDPARNIRALMASGGNVEGAIEWMFSNNTSS